MSTSRHDERALRILLSTKDLAELLEVRNVSTISNWRARHSDFPSPVISGHNAQFDIDDVLTWSRRPDTPARSTAPTPAWWWAATIDAVRAAADMRSKTTSGDSVRSYLVALVLLHATFAGEIGVDDDRPTWADLAGDRRPDLAMVRSARAIQTTNEQLDDLFVEPLTSIELTDDTTRELMERIDRFASDGLTSTEQMQIVLQRTARAVHGRQTSTSTQSQLAELLASIARPEPGFRIYDPCAGEGELLLACWSLSGGDVELIGQEIDPVASRIARSRLLISGAKFEFGTAGLSSLEEDQFRGLRVAIVVADPPVLARRSLDAWVDHALNHSTESGRVAISLPAHALVDLPSTRRRPDPALRQRLSELLDAGQVVSVAVVAPNLRRDVSGPMTVWRIDREAVPGRTVNFSVPPHHAGSALGPSTEIKATDVLGHVERSVAAALGRNGKSTSAASETSLRGRLMTELSALTETIDRLGPQLDEDDTVALRRHTEILRSIIQKLE